MQTARTFFWWFMLGSLTAFSVLLIKGEPIWDISKIAFLTPILGGGMLGGCIALILNRIRQT